MKHVKCLCENDASSAAATKLLCSKERKKVRHPLRALRLWVAALLPIMPYTFPSVYFSHILSVNLVFVGA